MNILKDDNIDNALSVFRSDRQFTQNSATGLPPRPVRPSAGTDDAGRETAARQETPNAGVKMYNLVILIIDILAMLTRWIFYTLEALYRFVVPQPADTVHSDIVLITGAGHGMGKCMALQYAQLGATVVCLDINERLNANTVTNIRQERGNAFGYVCDVTNREQIVEMAAKVKQDVGTVTILVNNAGIMPTHPLLQQTEAEIRKTFEINVMAHFWLLQSFLPGMIEKNRGFIVALSSVAGLCGLNNLVPYCGSKFAVRGIMEALSEELRHDARKPNIKFTTVFPYMVDTGLCKKPHMRFPNMMRLVKPEEAAAAIIDGQRRGLEDVSIPKYLLYLNTIIRVFPVKMQPRASAAFTLTSVDSSLSNAAIFTPTDSMCLLLGLPFWQCSSPMV
ncbi:short-chain dehydrogenase/reductase family 16C member 6 isoform X1 [Anopheles cruzii]|uniref:short-chain dehydrogenase/reductase family 16C member 6 isoform X1 n=1 Tax=Anopheles cruzii TaxID=68878 RepID=UPI0022EC1875|nr:short-chain dehydrogenase/reductase family 16C member 6 isoform X1 [Anopheles cruzii]